MRFNSRQAALLDTPDLPLGAFEHVGDHKIRPQGGGIPIVSDIVDVVSDVVGGVVDGVVDVITDIPVIGEIADDQLGLDPNGGGIVPIVKGVATGIVLSPVTGLIGPAINSSLGLGLGTAGQAALGGATFGAATGGAQGAVYGAAGGYLGSVASEQINNALNRTTVTFDDGSQLTYNTSTGAPVSGLDYNGKSFNVSNGVAAYADGSPLGGAAQTNFGSNQSWADYTPPPPPPEWQQAGFGNEASYADAQLNGFDSAQDYYTARSTGFENASDFAAAQAGGFPTADSYFDAKNMGFDQAGDFYDAVGRGFDNAGDYYTTKNFSYQDINAITNAGYSTDQIADLARSGFTGQDVRMLQADGYTPQQIESLVNTYGAETVRDFSLMDYNQADLNMLHDLGFDDQTIANLADRGVNEQTIKWYADNGYNPQAVVDASLSANPNEALNRLYTAGPDASFGRVTQVTDLTPAQVENFARTNPGALDSGRYTIEGHQIAGGGFGANNYTARLDDGRLIDFNFDTDTVRVKDAPWDPTWSDYELKQVSTTPTGTPPGAIVENIPTLPGEENFLPEIVTPPTQPVVPPTDVTWSDITGQEQDLVSNVGGEPTTNIVDEIVNNVRPEDQGTSEPVVVIANPSDVPGTGGLRVDINGDIVDITTGENLGNAVENGFNETAPGVYTDGVGTTITATETPVTPTTPVAPPVIPPTSDLGSVAPGVSPEVTPPVVEPPVTPIEAVTPTTPSTPPTTNTTVVVDNDGSIVVSDSNTGSIIGTVDNTGTPSGNISVTNPGDGSILISDTNTGTSLGGVDSSGNVFDITNGQGTYQGGGSLGGDVGGATGSVLGNGTGGGGTGGTTGPVTPETPVTPPTTPEVPVIDNSTPFVPNTPPPVDADIPPIIPVVPNPPTPPTYPPGAPYVPPPADPRWTKPLGENDWFPAYIAQVAGTPYYPTTDDAQSRYYWGAHTYVPIGGDITKYNQMSYAPTQAWGNQPQARPVAGPIAPAVYGPNMTPLR